MQRKNLAAYAAFGSKRIPERKCGIAPVKILRLNRRESKRVRVSRLVEPIIIPRHFVGEPSSYIDCNRRVWTLVVEVERAGLLERIQENRAAADKAAAVN